MSVLKELPYPIERSEKSKPFWEGLNENKLRTTKCDSCDTTHFPPAPVLCNSCFSTKISWVDLPLEGEVTSFTHVDIPPAGFDGAYTIVVVKLATLGKAIIGRYNGDEIHIGDRVRIEFEKIGDQSIIVFVK